MEQSLQAILWLSFDGDLAVTHARFRGDDSAQAEVYAELAVYPCAQIGNAPGNFIPGAPNMIASAGMRIGEATGWFAALRYRYFGPRPLTEDGAFAITCDRTFRTGSLVIASRTAGAFSWMLST